MKTRGDIKSVSEFGGIRQMGPALDERINEIHGMYDKRPFTLERLPGNLLATSGVTSTIWGFCQLVFRDVNVHVVHYGTSLSANYVFTPLPWPEPFELPPVEPLPESPPTGNPKPPFFPQIPPSSRLPWEKPKQPLPPGSNQPQFPLPLLPNYLPPWTPYDIPTLVADPNHFTFTSSNKDETLISTIAKTADVRMWAWHCWVKFTWSDATWLTVLRRGTGNVEHPDGELLSGDEAIRSGSCVGLGLWHPVDSPYYIGLKLNDWNAIPQGRDTVVLIELREQWSGYYPSDIITVTVEKYQHFMFGPLTVYRNLSFSIEITVYDTPTGVIVTDYNGGVLETIFTDGGDAISGSTYAPVWVSGIVPAYGPFVIGGAEGTGDNTAALQLVDADTNVSGSCVVIVKDPEVYDIKVRIAWIPSMQEGPWEHTITRRDPDSSKYYWWRYNSVSRDINLYLTKPGLLWRQGCARIGDPYYTQPNASFPPSYTEDGHLYGGSVNLLDTWGVMKATFTYGPDAW